MGCCSGIFFLLISISSLALLLTSNVATLGKNAANSSIFLIGINTNDLKSTELLPNLSASYAATELGFATNYIFGLYGYCRGDSELDTQTVNSIFQDKPLQNANCTDAKPAYYINPVEFVVDEINNHNTLGITIDENDIQLPGDLENYGSTIKKLSLLMYITSLIAIIATAFSIVFYFICFCFGGTFWVFLSQSIALIAAFLFAGSSTGAYTYVRNQFNDNLDQFGVNAVLSYRYLAITWVGTGLSLLTLLFVILSGCCCIPSRPRLTERIL